MIALRCVSQTACIPAVSPIEERRYCFNEQQLDSIIICGFDAPANKLALDAMLSANKDLCEVICMKDQVITQYDSTIAAKDNNERFLERSRVEAINRGDKLEKNNKTWRIVAGLACTAAMFEFIRRRDYDR